MDKIEIYLFCKKMWRDLIERDNGYMYEKHDEEVLKKASQKFDLTKEIIDSVFQELSAMEAKMETSGMNQQEIQDELKKILANRFE